MKTALTGDDIRQVRGIGCVIAPNKHPGRTAWRAQSPRYGTRSRARHSVRGTTAQYVTGAYVDHDDGTRTTYHFDTYREAATLATALISDNVPTDMAKDVIEQYRHYLDVVGISNENTLVTVNTGAGRGW